MKTETDRKCGACGHPIQKGESYRRTLVGDTHSPVCPTDEVHTAESAVLEWVAARRHLQCEKRQRPAARKAGRTDAARTRLVHAERVLESLAEEIAVRRSA